MKYKTLCVTLTAVFAAITGLAEDHPAGVVVSRSEIPVLTNPAANAEVQMMLTTDRTGDNGLYLGHASFAPGASIAEHVHNGSNEIVYLLTGNGQLQLGDRMVPVKQGDAVYIPKGLSHSFRNTGNSPVEVVQIYSPAGPEGRFRNWKIKRPE